MNRPLLTLIFLFALAAGLPILLAQENDWPRTLPLEQGTVTIYQLQVEELEGDVLRYRAALAYRASRKSEPVFGAGWFESPVDIDKANGVVHPTSLNVTQTRFPAGTADIETQLAAALVQESPDWNLDFSVAELDAALKQSEAESLAAQNLNTAPPLVIYRDNPALLVSLDGDPVLREIENSELEAVINTPYPLIYDGKRYHLNVARGVWYRSNKATGPYQYDARPPEDIVKMVDDGDAGAAEDAPAEPITAKNAPEIVVTTEPAELVVTDGPAAFVPLVDDLLVLQNSDDDVFMHVGSQKYYIVLAGRWYESSSLNGPWDFRAADQLPPAFANIPEQSAQADSRVYVAGTEEAEAAVLDAYVPQTAAVARGEVDIDVQYDGNPVYQPVDGTDLTYIANTGSTVLVADGLYYLVEDGVWYVSASPNGPWQVAIQRPAQVDTIMPTSPVHNVRYVQVYDVTPNVVYVGYTPGYVGSYVYGPTLVYGSGWNYQPWVSPYYYYPRFSTWGFNVSYNSWSGWNFGLSWGWGPFSVGYYSGGYWHHGHRWHNRHYGRHGPRGYRSRPAHYGRHGYGRNRYAHNDYGRGGRDGRGGRGGRGGDEPGRGGNRGHTNPERHDNLYRDSGQRARIADSRDVQRGPARNGADTRQKRGDRSRIGPVTPTELRTKADIRNANYAAKQNRLVADNSGTVYRKRTVNKGVRQKNPARRAPVKKDPVNRSPVNRASPSRSDRAPKVTKNRTKPVQPVSKVDGIRINDRTRVAKKDTSRSRQPVTVASSRSAKAKPVQQRDTYNRSGQRQPQVVNKTPQRQSQVVKAPARQSQQQVIKAPSRQSQPKAAYNRAPQRPPQAVSKPASGPAQNRSRSAAPAQMPSKSGRSKTQPVQQAPQRSAQKSSHRNTGSNSGGKHAGRGRDKKF